MNLYRLDVTFRCTTHTDSGKVFFIMIFVSQFLLHLDIWYCRGPNAQAGQSQTAVLYYYQVPVLAPNQLPVQVPRSTWKAATPKAVPVGWQAVQWLQLAGAAPAQQPLLPHSSPSETLSLCSRSRVAFLVLAFFRAWPEVQTKAPF